MSELKRLAIIIATIILLNTLLGPRSLAALNPDLLIRGFAQPDLPYQPARLVILKETTNQGSNRVTAAIILDVDPGWKTSWRYAGLAGLPTRLDSSGSHNLAKMKILWPPPQRFTLFGIDFLGYDGQTILPLAFQLTDATRPARLKLALDYAVCKHICIPARAEFDHMLLPGLSSESILPEDRAAIESVLANLPQPNGTYGIQIDSAILTHKGSKAEITLKLAMPWAVEAIDLFIEGSGSYSFAAPQLSPLLKQSHQAPAVYRLSAQGQTAVDPPPPFPIDSLAFTLTADDKALFLPSGTIPVTTANEGSSWSELRYMLLLSLAGGLLLNLMPCVFPVLALKLTHLFSQIGYTSRHIRQGFLATTFGILASFLIMGLALGIARSAGMMIGWGGQFQSPIFLITMAALLLLFAANLWDLFIIKTPYWLTQQALKAEPPRKGLARDALSGFLVALLATPCSAPYVGTAAAFAVTRGLGEIVMIFLALGFGLATPYILVAVWPNLVTFLPKPGPWMITLRRWLGLALAITAFWLLTIGTRFWGVPSFVIIITGMVALGAGLISIARTSPRMPALLLALIAFAKLAGDQPYALSLPATPSWERFTPQHWRSLIAQGYIVLVDITADWCITCKINDARLFKDSHIMSQLRDIRFLRADWTEPNAIIAQFLAEQGRLGIPFIAVYGPSQPQGQILPEIASSRALLEAIERVR